MLTMSQGITTAMSIRRSSSLVELRSIEAAHSKKKKFIPHIAIMVCIYPFSMRQTMHSKQRNRKKKKRSYI